MTEDKSQRCAHQGCTCHSPEGETYCSDKCREAAQLGSRQLHHECLCGHASCIGSAYIVPKRASAA